MEKILCSISGGKDSLAAFLLAKEKYKEVTPYFCDTGWEHPITYKYLKYLETKIGKIDRIRSEKYVGFEDMCIQRKMIPSRVKRFCTEELKIFPSIQYIKQWIDQGCKVINVVGIRQEESEKRRAEQMWKTTFLGVLPKSKKGAKSFYAKDNSFMTYQPCVYLSTQEVFDIGKKYGIDCNPLYKMGATRVGCYPCINSNTLEIGMLDKDAILKTTILEEKVSAVAGSRRYFFFDTAPISCADKHKKHKFNTLNLNLGCINQFGQCE